MILCVPVTDDDQVDPRWGRAQRVAVARVLDGAIDDWQVYDVSWDRLHDDGTPAQHHARVARFLKEHDIEGVVAHHVGEGMMRMVGTMKLSLFLDATGDARLAVVNAVNA
jgi:predicted Fe-Mo cluster-binding NifX family protein